ncbi:MAG: hypothetical protein HYW63_05100 [Candidatus Levybacteria bacterium]|nr:hypothetical protein [Candidatus Levybacteria bacterium]
MSSIFGFYYVVGLLRQMNWPRRRGLLNSEAVVSSFVLDSTIDQMIDWSASIGACRPKLALEIIATMFRGNDWDSKESFDIVKVVSDSKPLWNERGNKNPRDIVKPSKFSKDIDPINLKALEKDVISSKDLKSSEMREALEVYFFESLVWGLFNSNNFKTYFELNEKKDKEKLPDYEKAGLGVGSIPSLDQILKDGEEIIRGYEKEIRSLSPIPQKLIKDVGSLGIEVN